MKPMISLILIFFFSSYSEIVNPLPGTNWRLFSISDSEKDSTYNFFKLKSTLLFTDSTLEISGCNAMGGIYKFHSHNRITMQSIFTTELGCESFNTVEDYIASSFFDLTFKTHNDTLELHGSKGIKFTYLPYR
jgi:hypothetical protein